MAKFDKRLEARKMRRNGKSLGDISRFLKVSKSSVSIWCRDLILTDNQKKILKESAIKAGHKGRLIGAEMNKRKRLENIKMFKRLAVRDLGQISQRDLLVASISLYWAEGCKSGNRFIFINSDPQMIKLICRFLKDVLKISKDRFKATVQINEIHRPRIGKILSFWSSLLDLPPEQFGNPYFVKIKPKKVYDNHDSYYGIMRLGVNKSSDLQYKMSAYIDVLKTM